MRAFVFIAAIAIMIAVVPTASQAVTAAQRALEDPQYRGSWTCSGFWYYCAKGTTGRGASPDACYAAYFSCMKSGVFDTTAAGAYGRRRTNVERH
jgi:hypothetical protein